DRNVTGVQTCALPISLLDSDTRNSLTPRPGDMVKATVTHAAPYHLVADSALTTGDFQLRRTRAGDAWATRERAKLAGENPQPTEIGRASCRESGKSHV